MGGGWWERVGAHSVFAYNIYNVCGKVVLAFDSFQI